MALQEALALLHPSPIPSARAAAAHLLRRLALGLLAYLPAVLPP